MSRTDLEPSGQSPAIVSRIAHAKINLALHVTGRRADGFHLLDTLVVFARYGDRISLHPNPGQKSLVSLEIVGPFSNSLANNVENLVVKAATCFLEALPQHDRDVTPVRIVLEKNLPVASGIGGGSADGAATLLALAKYWNREIDLVSVARKLGADFAMCLQSRPLRARGIGDEITLLHMKEPLALLLVNPLLSVSTPEVFKKLKDRNNPPLDHLAGTAFPDAHGLSEMRNDLENPAMQVEPAISQVLEAIRNSGSRLVRMSGSGATCFGVFDTLEEAENARKEIADRHPHWWAIASHSTV